MLTDVTAMTTSRAVAPKAKSRSLPPVSSRKDSMTGANGPWSSSRAA